MSEPTLRVENLRTHFFTRQGVVKAVEDVSFSVGPGKILGLVGEEDTKKVLEGLLKIQAAFDLLLSPERRCGKVVLVP